MGAQVGPAARRSCGLAALFRSFHSGTSVDGAAQGVSPQRLGSASVIGQHPFPGDFRKLWAASVPFPSLPLLPSSISSIRCYLANGGSRVNSLLLWLEFYKNCHLKPIFISNHQIMRLGQVGQQQISITQDTDGLHS